VPPGRRARVYVVDACSLTALRRVYPRKNFPAVWRLMDDLARQGRLVSVEDVLLELDAQDDEVAEWARRHRGIFLPLIGDVQTKAREILRSHPTLVDLRKIKSSADPFLIATEEKPSGGPDRVKIPDVCNAYTVPCMRLLDLLQAEGLKAG